MSTGSFVYTTRDSSGEVRVMLHTPTGTTQLADAGPGGNTVVAPVVSPDGSKVAFSMYACYFPGVADSCSTMVGESQVVVVVNSDGSGLHMATTGTTDQNVVDWQPTWSPDSSWLAFERLTGPSKGIFKVRPDGSGLVSLIVDTNPGSNYGGLTWSPDGSKFAYARMNPTTYQMELYYSAIDGSGATKIPNQPSSGDNTEPAWAPNSARVYFQSLWMGNAIIDGINLDGSSLVQETTSSAEPEEPSVSADGNSLIVSAGPTFSDLFTVPTDGSKTRTNVTSDNGAYIHEWPSFVKSAYPAAPPSNTTVTLSAPSPHDAAYTRQVTIGLSATGVQRFEYGWSASATTAPNTSYLQTSTDLTGKHGTLNFLGKYGGSGTTWNGGTQPDQDWYLWVRSVKTNGTANAWGTPLKVHTPKRPVWVGVGDSYSSGHHQDADQPWCPLPSDTNYTSFQSFFNCPAGGTALTPNDLSYSWVKQAVDSYNAATHAPTDPATGWSLGLDLVAASGAPTSTFGVAGATPGSDAWASGTAQSAAIRADLYSRYDSWNVVSMTGGANDTNWGTVLANFYAAHFAAGSPAPWAVSTTNPATDCPDSQSVWNSLKANQSDGQTLEAHIKANLGGVVSLAARLSPGARVLNIGYPYVVDAANSCSADAGTWHGSKSVINTLNADHTAVTGSNVHYVDLTTSAGFGANPVTSGYLQLRRLYGYPHPLSTGQTVIANAAVANLTGSGW